MYKRLNITLPDAVLARADEFAARERYTRSGLIAAALEAFTSVGTTDRVAETPAVYAPAPAPAPAPVAGARHVAIDYSQSELDAICRRRAVKHLAFFGSVLREDFGPDSDVDVLVEFDHRDFEGKKVHLLPDELSRLFGGRKVDLVEVDRLNARLRTRVMSEALYVFAA